MEEWFELGCRKCGEGTPWKMETDGLGHVRATHDCGHMVLLKPDCEIRTKQDTQGHDMRLFT